MGALIPYLGSLSVGLTLVVFAVWAVIEPKGDLQAHLTRSAAAGAVPSGLVLIYGAFDPAILSQVPGLNVPIAFGGLSLLFVSLKAMVTRSGRTDGNDDA